MRKSFVSVFILLLAASFAACKKDDQVNATLKDLDVFTAELVKKIESSANPAAGVDEAQKFMDSKKSELKPKLDDMKALRGYEVSEETKTAITTNVTKNVSSVAGLQIKYVSRTMSDPAFKTKLEKLIKDYTEMLTT